MLRLLWHKRELLLSLTKRDLKTRYKASMLGLFWSIGKPLFLALIIICVFRLVFNIRKMADLQVDYGIFVLAGVLTWSFFTGTLQDAMNSILVNGNLIKKIKIDAEILPASSVLSGLIHFILALIAFHFILLCYGHAPGWSLLLLPVALAVHALLIMGMALMLSALNVFYRDVSSVTELCLSAWFYVCPIIYPVTLARRQFKALAGDFFAARQWDVDTVFTWAYFSNPMASILVAYQRILVFGAYPKEARMDYPTDTQLLMLLAYSLIFSMIFYYIGIKIFRKYSPHFSDEL
ncbi:ABC transporter permease [Candidatus Sumerlaeota bacterium]|nr:ABC transporter permease [Candidatus Sumerlaeota bacterium]